MRQIYEAMVALWPQNTDITDVLSRNKDKRIAGLYLGNYTPKQILNAVTRHSLYADKILLIDPLIYPYSVRPEYSPLENPGEHMMDTLKHLQTWFELEPWIREGIVEIVKCPGDFDHRLQWNTMKEAQDFFDTHGEFKTLLEADVEEQIKESEETEDFKRMLALSQSEFQLRNTILEKEPELSVDMVERIIQQFHNERDAHPYFIQPKDQNGRYISQLTHTTSGTNYPMGKLVANVANAYVFTNMSSRWKHIELDRPKSDASNREWEPLAKAFTHAKLRVLDNVPISTALQLRKENRLASMRSFFGRVWVASQQGNEFSSSNAKHFADEFQDKLNEAEYEWKKIDTDLLKLFAGEGFLGAITSVVANASLIPGLSVATAASINLFVAARQRSDVKKRYPAAFFLCTNK